MLRISKLTDYGTMILVYLAGAYRALANGPASDTSAFRGLRRMRMRAPPARCDSGPARRRRQDEGCFRGGTA